MRTEGGEPRRRTEEGEVRRTLGILACWGVLLAAVGAPQATEPPRPDPAGKGWLGVWLGDAVDGGAEVLAVVPGGPAQRAGLLQGDRIVLAADRSVANQQELGRVLESRRAGERVELHVLRSGEAHALVVELGSRAPRPPAEAPDAPLALPRVLQIAPGVRLIDVGGAQVAVESIPPALRVHFGAPADSGVLVTRVAERSPVARTGLRVGDVLVRLAGKPVVDSREVRAILQAWNGAAAMSAEIVRNRAPLQLDFRSESGAGAAPEPAGRILAVQARAERAALEAQLASEIVRLERRIVELRRELRQLRAAD